MDPWINADIVVALEIALDKTVDTIVVNFLYKCIAEEKPLRIFSMHFIKEALIISTYLKILKPIIYKITLKLIVH